QAAESGGPAITAIGANNLWYYRGWARGSWPISFQASDPSGVCSTEATVNGRSITGPSGVLNQTRWHQCPDQTWPISIDTANYGEGAMPVALSARNAAGVSSSLSTTVYIDNVQPTIALSGPTDAPSTAGVQYVTATAATT